MERESGRKSKNPLLGVSGNKRGSRHHLLFQELLQMQDRKRTPGKRITRQMVQEDKEDEDRRDQKLPAHRETA
jgi:hypothetical protein